ncbi:5222_t:CDS:2 [Diversispora eburnea]|uniref:5222_t:CDS:1 n=1 Tax=Diversispora eburnea TaxID=1213867 RepID=A0A9N8Z6S0_9GLOM|nr:5222_t:CDS:2 [Diversispora eburnea]
MNFMLSIVNDTYNVDEVDKSSEIDIKKFRSKMLSDKSQKTLIHRINKQSTVRIENAGFDKIEAYDKVLYLSLMWNTDKLRL